MISFHWYKEALFDQTNNCPLFGIGIFIQVHEKIIFQEVSLITSSLPVAVFVFIVFPVIL